jgi:flagellar hook-associated protein 3 FlgL
MRISTAYRFDSTVESLQRRQRDLTDAQASMTNGKRINKPSDDPTGAARAERALLAQRRIGSEQRQVDASRAAIALAESTLGHGVDLLQDARETLVSAGNGTYSASERQAQVAHLRNLRSQLLALANQGDGAGGYVFGGQSAGAQPFLDTAAGVVPANSYTTGETELSNVEHMPVTMDGESIWLRASSGNGVFVTDHAAANTGQAWINPGSVTDPAALTGDSYAVVFAVSGTTTTYSVLRGGAPTAATDVAYTPGSSITVDGMTFSISGAPADGDRFTIEPSQQDLDPFSALDEAISALSDPAAGGGQVAQAVSQGLRDVDSVLNQFKAARSEAGATLTRLDAVDSRNQDRALWAKTVQADAEDVDMVQAVSEFQNRQTGYQAALQSYSMVQRMSLLDYLK